MYISLITVEFLYFFNWYLFFPLANKFLKGKNLGRFFFLILSFLALMMDSEELRIWEIWKDDWHLKCHRIFPSVGGMWKTLGKSFFDWLWLTGKSWITLTGEVHRQRSENPIGSWHLQEHTEDLHYKKIKFEKCFRLDFAKVGSHAFHKLF